MKHLVHLDGTVTTMEADYSRHRGRYEVGPFFGGATERDAVEAYAAHFGSPANVLVADTAEDAEVMTRLVRERNDLRARIDARAVERADDVEAWSSAAKLYLSKFGHESDCHVVLYPDDTFEGCNCVVGDIRRGCMGDVVHALMRARRGS